MYGKLVTNGLDIVRTSSFSSSIRRRRRKQELQGIKELVLALQFNLATIFRKKYGISITYKANNDRK